MSVTAGSLCIPVMPTLVPKLDVCSNEPDCKSLPLYANWGVLPEDNGRVEHHSEEPFSSSVTQLVISVMHLRLRAGLQAGLAICSKVLICGSSVSTHTRDVLQDGHSLPACARVHRFCLVVTDPAL